MRRGVGVEAVKGYAEVGAVLERVASSPLWSRVRQKVLQIVENFQIYMPSESGRARPQPDMIYRPHFRYLCVPPPLQRRKVHAKHFVVTARRFIVIR